MGYEYVRKIPSKEEVLNSLPITENLKEIRKQRIGDLKQILKGNSNKFIVIIGPCSADREDAVLEYMERIAKVNEKIKDKVFIIPRVYTNKPRTTGEGYKGMLHQPDVNGKPDLQKGIYAIRNIHLKVLQEFHFITADEMLYPENYVYLEDLLGYVAIGARSVENQQHRLVSSGAEVPVGMKNPTSGDLSVMFNSIYAGQKSHQFIYHEYEVESTGNEYVHSILRGYMNSRGEAVPNYHYEDLMSCIENYKKLDVKNRSVIIDTNHSNSNKKAEEQPRIVSEILHSKNTSSLLNKYIKGVMIESYLVEGSQSIDAKSSVYGKSFTDSCLGIEETEKLLYNIAEKL